MGKGGGRRTAREIDPGAPARSGGVVRPEGRGVAPRPRGAGPGACGSRDGGERGGGGDREQIGRGLHRWQEAARRCSGWVEEEELRRRHAGDVGGVLWLG